MIDFTKCWKFNNLDDKTIGGVKRFMDSEMTYNYREGNEYHFFSPLKSYIKDNIYYCAWEHKVHEVDDNDVISREYKSRDVKGIVAVTKLTRDLCYEFGYKILKEDSFPKYYYCPFIIFKLLTKTNNANAIKWRNKVKEYLTKSKELKSLREQGKKIQIDTHIGMFNLEFSEEYGRWTDFERNRCVKTNAIIDFGYKIID